MKGTDLLQATPPGGLSSLHTSSRHAGWLCQLCRLSLHIRIMDSGNALRWPFERQNPHDCPSVLSVANADFQVCGRFQATEEQTDFGWGYRQSAGRHFAKNLRRQPAVDLVKLVHLDFVGALAVRRGNKINRALLALGVGEKKFRHNVIPASSVRSSCPKGNLGPISEREPSPSPLTKREVRPGSLQIQVGGSSAVGPNTFVRATTLEGPPLAREQWQGGMAATRAGDFCVGGVT